jgi:hypothetical protein
VAANPSLIGGPDPAVRTKYISIVPIALTDNCTFPALHYRSRAIGLLEQMAPLDYKVPAAKEQRRRDSTFPEWYFKLPDAPADVVDMTPLPENSGILSTKDIEITNSDATAVVEAIRVKKWTCVEVMEAFCKRAVLAQKYVPTYS